MSDDGPMTFAEKPTSPMTFGKGTSIWAEGKKPPRKAETLPPPPKPVVSKPPPPKKQTANAYLQALKQVKAGR